MRYFYKPYKTEQVYGRIVSLPYPQAAKQTLYFESGIGLCVIQKKFDSESKVCWYGELDACLANDIYRSLEFWDYFLSEAEAQKQGLFPIVTARQIMWSLRMKPLPKEDWERYF